MYRAGFRWILIGFESGSPRILQNINKKATRDDNTRCMDIAAAPRAEGEGADVGRPSGRIGGDGPRDRDWLLEVKPDDFDVTIITTYPGTPYYDGRFRFTGKPGVWTYTYEKTGDRLFSQEVDYTEVADYYKGDPDGGYKAFVYTDHVSAEGLVQLRDQTEADVRRILGIPFNLGRAGQRYEHSMGQNDIPAEHPALRGARARAGPAVLAGDQPSFRAVRMNWTPIAASSRPIRRVMMLRIVGESFLALAAASVRVQ